MEREGKKAAKAAAKIAALILLCIGGGYLLLVAAYSLPVGRMIHHVEESVSAFDEGGVYPTLILGMRNTKLDNYTDVIMMSEAIYNGPESVVEKAAGNYFSTNLAGAAEDPENTEFSPYSRYWHGYLIFLKPLLLFFNISEIRMLSMGAQLVLLALVTVQVVGCGRSFLAVPLTLTYVVLAPIAMFMSMQFYDIYYISFLALLALIWLLERGWDGKLLYLFPLIGCATSYFDFYTYPILTLGLPLTVYLIWQNRPLKVQLRSIFLYGAGWSAGYLGMWAGKWVLASIVTGQNIIGEALGQILYWTTTEDVVGASGVTRMDAVNVTVSVYRERSVYIVLILLAGLFYLGRGIAKRNSVKKALYRLIPFALVGLIPFAWCLLTKNHTYQHSFYTHRVWAVSWICFFCALLQWGCQKEIEAAGGREAPPPASTEAKSKKEK